MAASDPDTRSSSRFPALALALALVGAGAMLYYHLGLFIPRAVEARASIGLGKATLSETTSTRYG